MEQMSKEIKGNPCPKCGNTSFKIFIFSNVYTCLECGWVGTHSEFTNRIDSSESGKQEKLFQRILLLKELHDQNPEWDKTKLLHSSGEDSSIVGKYWELRTVISKLFR